jgi:hypothetical protein
LDGGRTAMATEPSGFSVRRSKTSVLFNNEKSLKTQFS